MTDSVHTTDHPLLLFGLLRDLSVMDSIKLRKWVVIKFSWQSPFTTIIAPLLHFDGHLFVGVLITKLMNKCFKINRNSQRTEWITNRGKCKCKCLVSTDMATEQMKICFRKGYFSPPNYNGIFWAHWERAGAALQGALRYMLKLTFRRDLQQLRASLSLWIGMAENCGAVSCIIYCNIHGVPACMVRGRDGCASMEHYVFMYKDTTTADPRTKDWGSILRNGNTASGIAIETNRARRWIVNLVLGHHVPDWVFRSDI